jgi:hypothetical protein
MTPSTTPRRRAARKSALKTASKPVGPSILQPHADGLRQAVHEALARAGVSGFSVQSISLAAIPDCPNGQHAEKSCTRDADGNEICTWNCVPN